MPLYLVILRINQNSGEHVQKETEPGSGQVITKFGTNYSISDKIIKLSYNILKMKISVISHLRCRGDQSIRLTEAGVQKENQAVLKRWLVGPPPSSFFPRKCIFIEQKKGSNKLFSTKCPVRSGTE